MAGLRYLLDTHCLIWFQEDSSNVPAHIMAFMQNPENTILFSQISLFEISIKQKIGKLPDFRASTKDVFEQAVYDGFTFLQITNQHIYNYDNVPLKPEHRDPFDRLLIATAQIEDAIILSSDTKFHLYKNIVKAIW